MTERAARPSSHSPVVRRAIVADARSIAEVTVATWRAAYRGILPPEFLASLRVEPREIAWSELLGHDRGDATPAWVVEDERGVRGFVSCGEVRDDDVPRPAGEVYALYVEPPAWRQGLGRRLLEAATERCLATTGATLTLWVLEANSPARHFYEAMGWQADGSRRDFELGGFTTAEVRYRRASG